MTNKIELQLLTIRTTADLLSVSRATTYRLISEGVLPGLKIRGSLRIPAASVAGYINEQRRQFEIENGIIEKTVSEVRKDSPVSLESQP